MTLDFISFHHLSVCIRPPWEDLINEIKGVWLESATHREDFLKVYCALYTHQPKITCSLLRVATIPSTKERKDQGSKWTTACLCKKSLPAWERGSDNDSHPPLCRKWKEQFISPVYYRGLLCVPLSCQYCMILQIECLSNVLPDAKTSGAVLHSHIIGSVSAVVHILRPWALWLCSFYPF